MNLERLALVAVALFRIVAPDDLLFLRIDRADLVHVLLNVDLPVIALVDVVDPAPGHVPGDLAIAPEGQLAIPLQEDIAGGNGAEAKGGEEREGKTGHGGKRV